MSSTLAIYEIKAIKEDRSLSGDEIFSLIKTCVETNNRLNKLEEYQRVCNVDASTLQINDAEKEMSGYLHYGPYGSSGNVKSTINSHPDIPVSIDDAVTHKYFFYLTNKNFSTSVILVAERKSNTGIEGSLENLVLNFYKNLKFRFEPIFPDSLIARILEEWDHKSIRITRKVPHEVIEDQVQSGPREENYEIETTIKAKKNKIFDPNIKRIIKMYKTSRNMSTISELYSSFGMGGISEGDITQIKVEVEKNNRKRTVNLKNDKMSSIYDLPAEVYGNSGEPIREMIETEAKNWVQELRKARNPPS
jgi:hypothetical protein